MTEYWEKKLKGDACFKALKTRRKKYKNGRVNRELSDVYLEIGDFLRTFLQKEKIRSKGFVKKIIRKYENAIKTGEKTEYHENCSLAYRALAEIALENDDSEEAITNIEKSMRYALRANNASFIQLCYHQCAYVYGSVPSLLEKAAEVGERGLTYLQENVERINADAEAVLSGGDSKRRKAGLENLLAGIYLDLENIERATKHNEMCLDYTSEHNDFELHYRALLLKLRMSNGIERLTIASEMAKTTVKILDKSSNLKYEAQFHLAVEELRFNNNLASKKLFWQLYISHLDRLMEDERELVKKYLIFIFKMERRLNRAMEINAEDRDIVACIFEKIADECVELQLNELAYIFYERMLKASATIEQKRLALLSLAETAREMKDFSVSVHFFRELYDVECKMGYSQAKLLETEISIAIVTANISTIPIADRLHLFDDVENKCDADDKINLLTNYVEFLEKNEALCSRVDIFEKRAELKRLKETKDSGKVVARCSQSSTDSYDDEAVMASSYADELDCLNDMEIFRTLRDEMKTLEEEQRLIKEKNSRVNNNGETRMHLAARSNDYELLKKLIANGYDVNAVDNGGWTPLSEAVSANQLRNVRLLLENGARVDCRSREFLVNEDDEQTSGSGQTPIMEACSNGNVAIAKILLCFKANIIQTDDDGWTCVDYLKQYFNSNAEQCGAKRYEELLKFIKFLENKQRLAGINPHSSPPRRLRKAKIEPNCSRKRRIIDDGDDETKNFIVKNAPSTHKLMNEDEHNLNVYRQTIQSLGRNSAAAAAITSSENSRIL